MTYAINALTNHIKRLEHERESWLWLKEHGYATCSPERFERLTKEIADCSEGLEILRQRTGGLLCD